jgi:hypothetical protein
VRPENEGFLNLSSDRSKFQILIPREAQKAMDPGASEELLGLSKPDRVVITPKPKTVAELMAGLHREVWQGAETYLKDEREAW